MSVLWGVSFDATPLSGVVVEFIKVAKIFHSRGYRVHLDLGYDIKADKNSFFRPYTDEAALLPDWVRLDRVEGIDTVPGYDAAVVEAVLREVVQQGDGERWRPAVASLTGCLSDRILATWERLGVSLVVVENGTLPENIAYTQALYQAIEEYGRRHRLGRFVLWRDHDLMWQSEPSAAKYGAFPYAHTPKPRDSLFIHYAALHHEALRRTVAWAPDLRNIDVLPNTFAHRPARVDERGTAFRRDHGIPDQVPLIARFTRIIPQKRIDRDIHLLAALADRTDAHLFIAGDPAEAPAEHAALVALAEALKVGDRVVFGGRLAPHERDVGRCAGGGYSVRDLLAHADVASFMTSRDYESYGNPIGEAIASRVPYVTTRYDLYDAVYASKGFRAPVLDTRAHDLPAGVFLDEVAELLTDEGRRMRTAEHNYRLGERHLGRAQAEGLLDRLFLTPMADRTRMSVVVPVYNEAGSLPTTLEALYHQRGPEGLLERSLYEVVLVDNNSTDDTAAAVRRFAADHPDLAIHLLTEPEQGVSCARRTGMEFASTRSRGRGVRDDGRFYLVSADADCRVAPDWLWQLYTAMESGKAAIGVCDYTYAPEHFAHRPRLWEVISRTLRCRAVTFALFGGFPDGKGFAVDRDVHDAVGGIEVFYQLRDGQFVNHLSDDWDFGIKVRNSGEDIVYAPLSRVEINPRRVDHALDEVITGRAYGSDGVIVMRDIRAQRSAVDQGRDLTEAEAREAWAFSVKDFVPKNTVLPVLLSPSLLEDHGVAEFFGRSLAQRLACRVEEVKDEMRMIDFAPIHSYKTPSYRLYFEFADEIFARLRATVGEDVGHPPPLPACLRDVPPERFAEFVRYYCEDRESGEAHNYFGNGGVF
ncbi:glycosyltransferase [Wenjunlia tyrosinilytica]|uniref:Glycosyl transferase n=1 Tax=Wenjunlia tyrosinilytica TaxID=1544741 RepID=A0A918E2I2_9ACTN|nr:glycosyltransferase [Wenjunlia tyrosinilytica]GGO99522.1 glycosyl transferase [Wenjunlia tyrosinilytica]